MSRAPTRTGATLVGSTERLVHTPTFSARPRREMAVRVCLPGLDATEHRLSSETAFPLTNTVIKGLSQAPHVKELEVLVVSGDHQLECILTPRLGSAPTSSRAVPIQRTLSEYTTRGTTVPDSTADKLAGIAAKTLPDELGIELCDVDLGPIRMWPVTTGRVLLETNGALRQSHFDWNDPFVETVSHLAATQKPFVVQVIIGTGTRAGYVATLRYAVIHPDHVIATGADESEHLEEGKHHSTEPIWQNAGLQTNYDLPISEFALPGYRYRKWTPEIGAGSLRAYDSPRVNKYRYMNRSDSQIALDLYTGTTEYRALFHGRPNATSLYEKLDRYARIPLNDYTLRLFGAVVPLYYETSPWVAVPARSGPEITTRAVLRRAPGTDQAHGRSESASSTEQSSGHTVNTGSDGHDQLLSFAVEYFRGQGDESWIETQDGSSMPDGGHRTSDGTKRALEVEFSSLSKPANLLTNYTRAIAQEHPVEFIVTSKAKARRLSEILRRPWKDETDHGAHLHTQTTTVRLPTGQIPVVPAKGTESNWYLDSEGELTLRTQSGTVFARGPATRSVATFAYDNPRYEHSTDDESHRIVTSEGVTKTTYRTRSQLLDEWTLVHAPFVPVGLHCLSGSTIYYQSGEELVEFDAQASWDRTAETATERYRRGVEEFVETYTHAEAGASMRYGTFQEACQSLFAVRSRHDPPNKTHIGRVLPDEVEVDSPNASTRKVRNRTLLYPSGLQSPDLPCFEQDEEDSEVEDKADDTDESADEGEPEGQ